MSDLKNIPFRRMDGSEASLKDFAGKVLLIVNVASKCGLTPQYEALERMQREYGPRGLVVLGFPANNFRAQEPGTNAEIEQFCKATYDVTFPVFQKISVKGADRHPLYTALVEALPIAQAAEGSRLAAKLADIGEKPERPSDVLWNFEKFLLDRGGQAAARFAPDVLPDSPALRKAIEGRL